MAFNHNIDLLSHSERRGSCTGADSWKSEHPMWSHILQMHHHLMQPKMDFLPLISVFDKIIMFQDLDRDHNICIAVNSSVHCVEVRKLEIYSPKLRTVDWACGTREEQPLVDSLVSEQSSPAQPSTDQTRHTEWCGEGRGGSRLPLRNVRSQYYKHLYLKFYINFY